MRPADRPIVTIAWLIAPVALLLLLGSSGCGKSHTLETGYNYRPLNATPTEIRGYYAGRFTPAARAAAMERSEELARRRPTPGN